MSEDKQIPEADNVASSGLGNVIKIDDERIKGHLDRVVRFDAGGGRACRNAGARPNVSLVFPPGGETGDRAGMSLVVDGTAHVDGVHVDVSPTWAVLHREAPRAP